MVKDLATGLINRAEKFEGGEPMAYIGNVVATVRIYASALTWINFLLASALVLMSLVPGTGTGGATVSYGAMPHIVWLIPNFLVLAFVLYTVADTSYININETTNALTSAFWFTLFSVVVNVVHVSMFGVEVYYQSSTFYLEGFPFLVVFMVAICVFVLWQLWIAARLSIYKATITNASAKGWNIGVELQQAALNRNGYMSVPAYQETPESAPAPALASAPTQDTKIAITPSAASINTPLLLPGIGSAKRAFGRKHE